MLSRRAFTQLVASLAATGALSQLLTPAAGARPVLGELEDPEEEPEEELEEQDDQDGTEDETEDDGEGEGDAEDSGNRLGQRKDEITPVPDQIAGHDNGKHNGLVNQPDDKPLRGVGYWANLTGAKSKKKAK